MPLIILILAVIGAIADWRYMQKGGRESSRKDWTYLLISIALIAALLVALKSLGSGNFIEGTVPIIIMLFGLWELSRWWSRRKYPLSKP